AAPGSLASPQTPILTLVPPDLELVVNIEELHVGEVAEGQPVHLEVPAFPRRTFTGVVKSIAPTLDTRNRTAAVRIEPSDEQHQLRAGMFARLSIITASSQDAVLVPREAILSDGSGAEPAVLSIDQSGTVHKHPVQLGLQSDRFAQIVAGVRVGELVATSGLSNLNDGDVVAPQGGNRIAMAPDKN
ncbi:MAG: efflux RND transporter periplasmic adaptor subunit, partial [Chloroflexota bacterium]|nr:efflux RND transporter periplasmic adaptor subunit [Chloroflexota bacterium]